MIFSRSVPEKIHGSCVARATLPWTLQEPEVVWSSPSKAMRRELWQRERERERRKGRGTIMSMGRERVCVCVCVCVHACERARAHVYVTKLRWKTHNERKIKDWPTKEKVRIVYQKYLSNQNYHENHRTDTASAFLDSICESAMTSSSVQVLPVIVHLTTGSKSVLTDDGVDAETFLLGFRINSTSLLRHLKTSLIDHAREVKNVLQPSQASLFVWVELPTYLSWTDRTHDSNQFALSACRITKRHRLSGASLEQFGELQLAIPNHLADKGQSC